ncbi:magnesium transporter MgtE N-terminal domain-containing protein [Pelomicrobium sp. G1]|uniref:magnesium transporter MgtE N-terminal domain-containing protein n=1 Tax=unclassified Pelomicrobium TaxID=2815318 RepID=UPI003F75DD95
MNGLTLTFVEGHPADAARVLEGLPAPESAAFVARLPARLGALLLRYMAPLYGGRLLALLDDKTAVALVERLSPHEAAGLLQQLSSERQARLLQALPVATAVALRLLIGYPRGTCGAAMDPWPPTASPGTLAEEALAQVRAFDGDPGDALLVVNGQRRLLGVVPLAVLVKATPRDTLMKLMRPPVHAVSALATLASVAQHSGWAEFHALPVVERDNRLVGRLHRSAVNPARQPPLEAAEGHLGAGLAAAYWQVLAALAQMVVGVLPAIQPIDGTRKSDER